MLEPLAEASIEVESSVVSQDRAKAVLRSARSARDSALADTEDAGDLGVRVAVEGREDERRALRRLELCERKPQVWLGRHRPIGLVHIRERHQTAPSAQLIERKADADRVEPGANIAATKAMPPFERACQRRLRNVLRLVGTRGE